LHFELHVRYVSVAVPVPFLDRLTYNVPDHLELPMVGARVRVPIGKRVVTGCVVQQSAEGSEPDGVKDLVEVLDREPFLPPGIVKLCEWVADYYLAGIGDAIAVAMPPGARARASSFKTRQVATITAHGLAWGQTLGQAPDQTLTQSPTLTLTLTPNLTPTLTPTQSPNLTPKQRAALEILAAAGVGLPIGELRDRGVTRDVLARLATRGFVALHAEAEDRDPFERAAMPDRTPDPSRDLTAEQRTAFEQLAALVDAGGFRTALLHGVTGSGKTEIYLRLSQAVQRTGRQVLLLVPEIALTPSVTALFRGAFGDRVAIQHSALSDGERHDQWHRIRRGDVDLVIGTRSAVFAPLTRLGLIIVDEEHDTSYKQEEAPRYHGRDVAIVRATHEGALVVLGSATPSMESYQNALSGKYAQATLERRVLDRPLAAVRIVNMRAEYAEQGPDAIISRDLAAAVADRLARREQVLVLLNRRGYATAVFCRQCGDTFECPNCTISLTVHRVRPAMSERAAREARRTRVEWRARCHYCNYSMMVPKACRKCAAPYLERAGFGTEKVEEQLAEAFPNARIGRVDRDSVRRKGALTSLLSRFAAGELDILVGTQMIAKGHDFPGVTLVGVVSADVGLGLADFRAAERTFQLLTQVAGRAGRGERTGEAIVQTLYPDHYSIQLACRQDYRAFFERELAYRRGMRYPPMVALINTIVRGRTFDEAMQTATEIVRRIEPATATAGLTVLGPAPAPLVRLRGEHRVQFLVKGMRRAEMRRALQAALADMPQVRRRVTVDVDPLTVL
jgi:primosomal protein N' (replication factor Y) (superfamily II helicase)